MSYCFTDTYIVPVNRTGSTIVDYEDPDEETLMLERICEMMEDDDIALLDEPLRLSLRSFAESLVRAVSVTRGTSVAIFGDRTEGEVVLTERSQGREIQLTVHGDVANAWIAGNTDRIEIANIPISKVGQLGAIFNDLDQAMRRDGQPAT